MWYGILEGITEQIKDISGKTDEILIRTLDKLILLFQC